jgi:hypothetical protein
MDQEMLVHLTLVNTDEKYDRTKRCEAGHDNKDKDDEAT